jgi:hypothetical protein
MNDPNSLQSLLDCARGECLTNASFGWHHIKTLADETERLTRDRDLWKERHDRERAAHAKNLTEQQKCEAERDRLRAGLQRIFDIANGMQSAGPDPIGPLHGAGMACAFKVCADAVRQILDGPTDSINEGTQP